MSSLTIAQYYEVLGIPMDSPQADVTKAWRNLQRKCQKEPKKLAQINEAKTKLTAYLKDKEKKSDPTEKRKELEALKKEYAALEAQKSKLEKEKEEKEKIKNDFLSDINITVPLTDEERKDFEKQINALELQLADLSRQHDNNKIENDKLKKELNRLRDLRWSNSSSDKLLVSKKGKTIPNDVKNALKTLGLSEGCTIDDVSNKTNELSFDVAMSLNGQDAKDKLDKINKASELLKSFIASQ